MTLGKRLSFGWDAEDWMWLQLWVSYVPGHRTLYAVLGPLYLSVYFGRKIDE